MKTFQTLLAVVLFGVASTVAHGGALSSDINRIRKDSPLHDVVKRDRLSYDDKKIRDKIAELIQPGATYPQIEAFVAKHFTETSPLVRSAAPDAHSLYQPKEPFVFIRTIDKGGAGLGGGETVEIYLVLNSDKSLKEVVVRGVSSYL